MAALQKHWSMRGVKVGQLAGNPKLANLLLGKPKKVTVIEDPIPSEMILKMPEPKRKAA
jgi:hypothetical protein